MKDRFERFVLLPFTAGCICESSIPVVTPYTKRSKHEKHDEEKEREEEGCFDEEASLSGQNLKSNLPKFQKLFKNFKDFSQFFVYKDVLEQETGMEIGFPTDVKHVTHIGLDGCTSYKQELINLHSLPFSELELAIKAQGEKTPNIKSSLENKCRFDHTSTAMRVMHI